MNPFLPTIVTLPADAEPACADMWSLFDSTEPDDHETAKRICATCDVSATCASIALAQRDSATGRLGLEGTWAGQLWENAKTVDQRKRKADAA